MAKATTKILKSSSLNFEGAIKIGSAGSANTAVKTPQPINQQSITEAKAIVVENTPQFVVIEVTCNCGNKMYLRCNYDQTQKNEL